ncbi:hemerythrin-like domain-containing protein [Pontibacter aydingkolensis]|uniref:Hemerythrin domain-containing protein n=1 Tax=Pontibacter aydingkolensis TaxID=1911536 RepID=A0ABS7CRX0_9BACT|nr:hemerythrin domain-containing protein [Pontibacter aydingkolensis]MBW7466597.1 hemerythrin domain-containing protein [Pontibacter aydingkolensis]
MKRHESLVPISRQHHSGLLTARLLQYGAPPYKEMPTTPEAKRSYTLDFLDEHLRPHFKLEEETVFILAPEVSEELAKQTKHLLAQHRELEKLILALPDVKMEALPDKLDEIGKLLEQHIRHEERVFFEQLQQELPDEKLKVLQEMVLQHLG